MRTSIKNSLNSLQLSDIYSLMLFLLFQVKGIPEFAVLSELCYLLDGNNLTRLLTYFSGKTVKFPTAEEFVVLTNALLLYQYINIEGNTLVAAQARLPKLTAKQKDKTVELYLQILPIIKNYNIDRGQMQKNDR